MNNFHRLSSWASCSILICEFFAFFSDWASGMLYVYRGSLITARCKWHPITSSLALLPLLARYLCASYVCARRQHWIINQQKIYFYASLLPAAWQWNSKKRQHPPHRSPPEAGRLAIKNALWAHKFHSSKRRKESEKVDWFSFLPRTFQRLSAALELPALHSQTSHAASITVWSPSPRQC